MLAVHCDRCGKQVAQETVQSYENIIVNRMESYDIDLCMDCYTELMSWLKCKSKLPASRGVRLMQYLGSEQYKRQLNSTIETKEAMFCSGLATGALLMLQDSYGNDE